MADNLPLEIWLMITPYLNHIDTFNLARCSHRLYAALQLEIFTHIEETSKVGCPWSLECLFRHLLEKPPHAQTVQSLILGPWESICEKEGHAWGPFTPEALSADGLYEPHDFWQRRIEKEERSCYGPIRKVWRSILMLQFSGSAMCTRLAEMRAMGRGPCRLLDSCGPDLGPGGYLSRPF
ncbi:hypothetical protein ASPWEDRAFT_37995 [Aspergillus wentii DTO 134E9]|uniref:F-box domain-containing protein n=1 Tax=Aspergillus wentii DTO 134E9 TaxID=1073089 RepID=A0A1L9RNL4_ASPWE|nr:uncharacterized protein ASPWEDRAFT_37995 [Aspergillus wentii DTO 134E9]KAI9926082.1 hypothetical protein MW887_004543 [Aspergillus wentii]OJJ36427.1 hypothetical protein ASPWEDRAFT_37995 [Aspergillus wentii DTO 134E9]